MCRRQRLPGRISNHYASRIAGNNGIGGGYRGGAETAAGRVEVHHGMIFFPTGLSGDCECSRIIGARLAGCFGLPVDRQGPMRGSFEDSERHACQANNSPPFWAVVGVFHPPLWLGQQPPQRQVQYNSTHRVRAPPPHKPEPSPRIEEIKPITHSKHQAFAGPAALAPDFTCSPRRAWTPPPAARTEK